MLPVWQVLSEYWCPAAHLLFGQNPVDLLQGDESRQLHCRIQLEPKVPSSHSEIKYHNIQYTIWHYEPQNIYCKDQVYNYLKFIKQHNITYELFIIKDWFQSVHFVKWLLVGFYVYNISMTKYTNIRKLSIVQSYQFDMQGCLEVLCTLGHRHHIFH